MRKITKFCLFILCVCLFSGTALCFLYAIATEGYEFDVNKLSKTGTEIIFVNASGEETEYSAKGAPAAKIDALPSYVKNAFIAVEDKRFYSHSGVDYKAVMRAAKNNVLSLSFKEGGSTITQQLIKNTHLSGEKTIFRKMREYKLTRAAEKRLSKNSIMEYYLNGIYFGENVYGIESAANRYFGKRAKDLTLAQSAALAATVKSPAYYNPAKSENLKRRNLVIKLMREQNLITEAEKEQALAEPDEVFKPQKQNEFFKSACDELFSVCSFSPYSKQKIKVYTAYSPIIQQKLNAISEINGKAAILVTDELGEILAQTGNVNLKRSPASTIKPILVYAPALELGYITPASQILDEHTDFAGYSPKNPGDKYFGWVSAEYALEHSLNVPACKILNSIGTEKAAKFAKNAGINISDESLACALGSIGNGVSVTDLASAYGVFQRGGEFIPAHYIKKVTVNGKTLYDRTNENGFQKKKVFSSATCELINDMLEKCAKSGTAKALNGKDYPVCAKTGTNGNKNGNYDALCISYTPGFMVSVRISGEGENGFCGTSGGRVAKINGEILDYIYENLADKQEKARRFFSSGEVANFELCKPSYEEQKLLLADSNAAERYKITFPFKIGTQPPTRSSLFSAPHADGELQVNGSSVLIKVRKHDFIYCDIYRKDKNGKEKKIATLKKADNFYDDNLSRGIYSYSVIPYFSSSDDNVVYGDKIELGNVLINDVPSDWWKN